VRPGRGAGGHGAGSRIWPPYGRRDLPPIEAPAAMANDRHDRSPTDRSRAPAAAATRAEIGAFLAQVKDLAPSAEPGRRGRLIFPLHAPMTPTPTWHT